MNIKNPAEQYDMITPEEIHDIFSNRGVQHLRHANSVTTACTYLKHGALLSRNYIEQNQLRQTSFDSDEIDKEYGIWDRVFLDNTDIHSRGGRVKGANLYGPVLFEFPLDTLLALPKETTVEVTRVNPIHWTKNQKHSERYFETAAELRTEFRNGDFDKMLVLKLPEEKLNLVKGVHITLDDPKRDLSPGVNAYDHANEKLANSAASRGDRVRILKRECSAECKCLNNYRFNTMEYFSKIFDLT